MEIGKTSSPCVIGNSKRMCLAAHRNTSGRTVWVPLNSGIVGGGAEAACCPGGTTVLGHYRVEGGDGEIVGTVSTSAGLSFFSKF